MQERSDIARRIRHLRYLKNWTQAELAEATGLPRSCIGMYETDGSRPPYDFLVTMWDKSGFSPVQFYKWELPSPEVSE